MPVGFCQHTETVLTRKREGKTKTFCFQCQECGQDCGMAENTTAMQRIEAKDFNYQLHWQWKQQQYQRDREAETEEFWTTYEAHLKSEKWQNLRLKIFDRCGGICEGCGVRKAAHVHHLNYKHLGDELLFDLVAVCLKCHQKIHPERVIDYANIC